MKMYWMRWNNLPEVLVRQVFKHSFITPHLDTEYLLPFTLLLISSLKWRIETKPAESRHCFKQLKTFLKLKNELYTAVFTRVLLAPKKDTVQNMRLISGNFNKKIKILSQGAVLSAHILASRSQLVLRSSGAPSSVDLEL